MRAASGPVVSSSCSSVVGGFFLDSQVIIPWLLFLLKTPHSLPQTAPVTHLDAAVVIRGHSSRSWTLHAPRRGSVSCIRNAARSSQRCCYMRPLTTPSYYITHRCFRAKLHSRIATNWHSLPPLKKNFKQHQGSRAPTRLAFSPHFTFFLRFSIEPPNPPTSETLFGLLFFSFARHLPGGLEILGTSPIVLSYSLWYFFVLVLLVKGPTLLFPINFPSSPIFLDTLIMNHFINLMNSFLLI